MANMRFSELGLFTDLYELRMAQAYLAAGLTGTAVFTLFVRRLPEARNFLLACGLESALAYLEHVRRRAAEELAALPARVTSLERADPPYPVSISAALAQHHEEVRNKVMARRSRVR